MDDFKRREFIKLSALGFAAIALQLNAVSTYAQMANGHFGKWNAGTPMNWDAFLERLTQLAKTQHQLPWDQKMYTEQVKQLLLQCNFPEFENIKKEIDGYEDKHPNHFEAAGLHREVDFQVSLFQFEKGEYISHHDHPDMTGVINVVSGNILAKNYSVEEQLVTQRKVVTHGRTEVMSKCIIKETGNEIVKGGDVSILTAHEGNIHALMPNEYTQMVDVFTPAYSNETKTTWYTVNEDGWYEGRKNTFEAEYMNKDLSKIATVKLSRRTLDNYAGSYKMKEGRYFKVYRKNRDLFIEPTQSLDEAGSVKHLLPYAENKFWLEGEDVRCVFNLNEENAIESLTLHVAEREMTAGKIK